VGAKIVVHCGTIAEKAAVIWKSGAIIGVHFETRLSEAQVQEQVSRSTAISARRASLTL
jgi:hypothetical protein